eukprot:TRINITY_DN9330_c0_g1_i1.p1 TRINITY_DN9330_c0_g1~~TRINITY_DN9330_c0_g1_i1.p1  ORF type:complete len:306 (+),score=46.13 TRINITY_DN9330_c0_g1_i1:27-920(+)
MSSNRSWVDVYVCQFTCRVSLVDCCFFFFFFQAEDGIRDVERSRGLGDVYKRQVSTQSTWGIGWLLQQRLVDEVHASYVGENPIFEKQYMNSDITLNVILQGFLAERIRARASGIGALLGTIFEEEGFTSRIGRYGKSVVSVSAPKEKHHINGRDFLLEEQLKVDFSMIKAYQGDKYGNSRFRKTARNFNPEIVGPGITLAEVEQLANEILPEKIHFPGCFVDRIYQAASVGRKIERLRLRHTEEEMQKNAPQISKHDSPYYSVCFTGTCRRYVLQFRSGISTLVANHIIDKSRPTE